MSTARCLATFPASSTLFTVDSVHKGKISNITIDNRGAADHTLIFSDSFTTDASQLAAAAPVVKPLRQLTVGHGLTAVISEEDLKDVEVFGSLTCVDIAAAEALCVITASYHEE